MLYLQAWAVNTRPDSSPTYYELKAQMKTLKAELAAQQECADVPTSSHQAALVWQPVHACFLCKSLGFGDVSMLCDFLQHPHNSCCLQHTWYCYSGTKF